MGFKKLYWVIAFIHFLIWPRLLIKHIQNFICIIMGAVWSATSYFDITVSNLALSYVFLYQNLHNNATLVTKIYWASVCTCDSFLWCLLPLNVNSINSIPLQSDLLNLTQKYMEFCGEFGWVTLLRGAFNIGCWLEALRGQWQTSGRDKLKEYKLSQADCSRRCKCFGPVHTECLHLHLRLR